MRLIVLALFGLMIFASLVSAAIPSDCSADMVALFKFDGDTTDSYGSLVGSPHSSYSSFKVGQSANFSSSSLGPITFQDSNGLLSFSNKAGFTVELWFEIESDAKVIILDKGSYKVLVDAGVIYATVSSTSGEITASAPFSSQVPRFVTLVWTAALGKVDLYLNGVLANTASAGFSQISQGSPSLKISSGGPFDGLVDEVAFYDAVLDSSEISSHYSLSNSGKDYCATSGGDFSSIKSEFTVAGCKTTTSGGTEIEISPNSCSRDGFYFCDSDGDLYRTLFDEAGCSMGSATYSGGAMCCPTGYVCKEDANEGGILVCNLGGKECGSYSGDRNSCEDAGCYYVSQDNSCVTSPTEYGCGIYETQSSCLQDTYNVGGQGMGTEVCAPESGYYDLSSGEYIVLPSSCECVWDSNECKLSWEFTESLHDGNPNSYECRKSFDFGSCVGGNQKVSWIAAGVNGRGIFSTGISEEALKAPGCVAGEISRNCGEPIIKLPGISPFAIFSVIGALALFYFLRKED